MRAGWLLSSLMLGLALPLSAQNPADSVAAPDTNGAVTGALAGARFGADAIPQRWVEPLLRKEVVSGLANRLTRT